MAFPSIRSSATALAETVSGTSHTITLPATVNAGDLLMVFVSFGEPTNTITWDNSTHGTWSEGFAQVSDNSMTFGCWYKVADGTEDSGSLTVTTSASTRGSGGSFAIQDWHGSAAPEFTVTDHGTAQSDPWQVQPGTLTPTWGSGDTLWGCVSFNDRSAATPSIDAYPSGYSDTGSAAATATSGTNTYWAWRTNAASSETPGVYDFAQTGGKTTVTVGVRPASGSSANYGRNLLLGVG